MPGTPLREIFARFGFEFDQKAFKKADSGLTKLKSNLVNIARFVVAGAAAQAIKGIATETAKLGDQIATTSTKLGINAQALQELRFAGELTGVSVKSMDIGLQRFTRRAAEAAKKGTGPVAEALKQMNVRLKDSRGNLRPVEDLLGDVSEGFKDTKDQAERVRLAFTLFDTEGVAMVNTLSGGKDALEAMREEARLLGGIMDEKLIKTSVEFTATQLRMSKVIRGIKNVIAGELLPAMINSMKGTIEWVRANGKLIRSGLQRFFKALISVIRTVSTIVGAVVKGIAALLGVFSPLTQGLIIAITLFGVLGLAMGWPIAVAAALLLVLDDVIAFFDGRKSVTGGLVDAIKEMYGLLIDEPIDPEAVWFVQLMQIFLKQIEAVAAGLDALFQNPLEALARGAKDFFSVDTSEEARSAAERKQAFLRRNFSGVPELSGSDLLKAQQRATIPGGGVGGTVNSSPTINQTINAPAGASPQDIGAEAAKQIRAVQRQENKNTLRAMVPG